MLARSVRLDSALLPLHSVAAVACHRGKSSGSSLGETHLGWDIESSVRDMDVPEDEDEEGHGVVCLYAPWTESCTLSEARVFLAMRIRVNWRESRRSGSVIAAARLCREASSVGIRRLHVRSNWTVWMLPQLVPVLWVLPARIRNWHLAVPKTVASEGQKVLQGMTLHFT
jgi:hypothetical protein